MAGLSIPSIPVKVFIFLHFVFTCWAVSIQWLPNAYIFCHLVVIIFGIWVIVEPASHDANQLLLLSVAFALINDCILIGIYFNSYNNSQSSNLRFAVSFAFFNLFLKPFTAIFILVNYQEKGGFDYTQAFMSPAGEQNEYQPISDPSRQQNP